MEGLWENIHLSKGMYCTLLNILVIRHPGALLFFYANLQDSQDTHLEKEGEN